MSNPVASLLSIGDAVILEANFIERLASIQSFSDSVIGETVDRALVREFQWGIDGVNYSSWLALTDPMLQALALDANNRFYIRVRYTRQGTDASGIIQIFQVAFNWTIDPMGTTGHGAISYMWADEELPELIKAMIESAAIRLNDKLHYEVIIDHPSKCSTTYKSNRPQIYLHEFDLSEIEEDGNCHQGMRCTFSVAITKRKNKTVEYPLMVGIVRSMFQQWSRLQFSYSLEFKSVNFIDVKPGALGIAESRVNGYTEVYDKSVDETFKILFISVLLSFPTGSNNLL